MRRGTMLLAVVALAGGLFSNIGAQAHKGCDEAEETQPVHKHTRANTTTNDTTPEGSCKDTDSWKIACAGSGEIAELEGVRVWVTQTNKGAEVEACNDSGSASTKGRLVGVVDQDNGVRFALDSDNANPQGGPGYINAQVYLKDPENKSGVWCSSDPGESGDSGDGYARTWTSPGKEGGLDTGDPKFPNEGSPYECKPNFLPIP